MIDAKKRLIAILRGIAPEEIAPVIHRLIDCGFRAIEIPLNSPRPFESLENAARIVKGRLGDEALIGAGTVLTAEEVQKVAHAGGNVIVSPNVNEAVIAKSQEFGLTSYPGVFTASEAFTAIAAGASGLKIFPAATLGASGIAALTAVLPPPMPLYAVGGIGPEDFAAYRKAGVYGFGLGSSLYKAGMSLDVLEGHALAAIRAMEEAYKD